MPEISDTLKVSPTKFFGTVRQKILTESRDTPSSLPPLLSIIFIRYQFFLIHRSERFLYEIFQHWDKKNFDTKSWDKSLKHKIFRYPKLVTHWRFPLPNFSALWDRHFSTENRDTPSSPPPSYPKVFSIPESFWNKEGFPYEVFSVLWDNNFFYRKSWYSPLMHKVFRYPKFSETHTVCSTKFFVLWDENFSTENRDTLLHKVHKSVVELMFVRTLWKLIS